MAREDCIQRRRWSWGGTIYSAVDGPGGPILEGTTYSMTIPQNTFSLEIKGLAKKPYMHASPTFIHKHAAQALDSKQILQRCKMPQWTKNNCKRLFRKSRPSSCR